MAALLRGIFTLKKTAPVREKMMVVEKKNMLGSAAFNSGVTVAKAGLGITALSYVGMEAQQFKGNLMKGLFDGSNTLDNLGNNLGEKFDSVKNDLITGIVVVGSFGLVGYIIYRSL